jgi:hypothetical protein
VIENKYVREDKKKVLSQTACPGILREIIFLTQIFFLLLKNNKEMWNAREMRAVRGMPLLRYSKALVGQSAVRNIHGEFSMPTNLASVSCRARFLTVRDIRIEINCKKK